MSESKRLYSASSTGWLKTSWVTAPYGSRGARKLSCRSARAFMAISLFHEVTPHNRAQQKALFPCRPRWGAMLTVGHVRRLVRPPIDPRPRRPRSGPPPRPRRCAAIRGGAGDADHRRERAAPAFSASRRAARDRGALRRDCHGL